MARARLLYSAIASLDGYVADVDGRFDWAAPSVELHRLVNEREASVGTYLYGRRMYEVMRYWGSPDAAADRSEVSAAYRRIWQAADKVVYSTSLDGVDLPRTRLVRELRAEEVRSLVDESPADVSVGGPTLAAQALRAGLVDEVTLYLCPVTVGGGTAALPTDQRIDLRLLEERRVGDVVLVRYEVARPVDPRPAS